MLEYSQLWLTSEVSLPVSYQIPLLKVYMQNYKKVYMQESVFTACILEHEEFRTGCVAV